MNEKIKKFDLFFIFLVVLSWFLITEWTPYLNRLFHFRQRSLLNLLAALRMTLMFLVTLFYVRAYEKKSFASGFNFSFQKIGKNLLWAFIFFLVAGLVLFPYQYFLVRPLTEHPVQASNAVTQQAALLPPLMDRLVEFCYIVYEGIIEVLIFIGFFLDRLARRWGWTLAVLASNVVFALWHYSYWRKGWLEGSLMIALIFISGIIDSLSYLKTRNSLSPAVCHFLVDLPTSIRELLGII